MPQVKKLRGVFYMQYKNILSGVCVSVCEMGLSGCGLEVMCITKTWSHSYSTSLCFVV